MVSPTRALVTGLVRVEPVADSSEAVPMFAGLYGVRSVKVVIGPVKTFPALSVAFAWRAWARGSWSAHGGNVTLSLHEAGTPSAVVLCVVARSNGPPAEKAEPS